MTEDAKPPRRVRVPRFEINPASMRVRWDIMKHRPVIYCDHGMPEAGCEHTECIVKRVMST